MAAAATSYAVRSPQWVLIYSGVNITDDVSQMVLSITYLDRLNAASSEVEIELEDSRKRWQGSWYPVLGDRLSLLVGYHGEQLLPCGDFQVDELALVGPPDVFRLRCLATYITPAMRTANTVGYEGQSLLQIAAAIAAKYGLQLVSAPDFSDLGFARVTQRHETDLAFLKRLANEHGYDFTVRGSELVFYALPPLEAVPPAITLMRQDTERFAFRNRTRRIYQSPQVAYQDPDTKRLIFETVTASPAVPTGDSLKIITRCESGEQAMVKAEAALHRHNMVFVEAEMTLPGTTTLVAGSTALLSGWGMLDGTYLIESARHRLNRSTGYITEIEVRSVSDSLSSTLVKQ